MLDKDSGVEFSLEVRGRCAGCLPSDGQGPGCLGHPYIATALGRAWPKGSCV